MCSDHAKSSRGRLECGVHLRGVRVIKLKCFEVRYLYDYTNVHIELLHRYKKNLAGLKIGTLNYSNRSNNNHRKFSPSNGSNEKILMTKIWNLNVCSFFELNYVAVIYEDPLRQH